MTFSRRKILFVLPSLMGGGAEQVIMILLRHLDRSHFEPHLALVRKAGTYLAELPEDVPVHDLQASRVRYAFLRLVRLVRSLKPDVVVSTFRELNSALLVSKWFLPRNTRLMVREDVSVSAELAQDVPHAQIWSWVYRHYYPRADKIICDSEYVRNDLAEHYGISRAKMIVIYNPVDVERVRLLADEGENPFKGPGPHLVAAGRLKRQKGFDLLLDALALVRKSLPAKLTLLGDGPLELDLKAQSERLGLTGAVQFVGFQTNPYPYFRHADLFVLSSRYEGLPLVVLAAVALGKPVVAMDCPGGVKEILEGCTGCWLVPELDARHLAEALESALGPDTGKSPTAKALETTLSKFRSDRIVLAYENHLSE